MELPGSDYLFTLAQVGITFSGFSALLIAVGQMRGIGLSDFHNWVARIFVLSGMATTANAMLAPLLFGMGLSESMTWRATSALIVAGSIYRLCRLPRQWRTATHRPMEMRMRAHIGLIVLLNAALVLNAAGWPFAPSGGVVMFAISWNLFAFFFQFTESFRFFFEAEKDIES
jgi:hypothetical protein